MKYLLSSLFVGLSFLTGYSQNFQGKLVFSVTYTQVPEKMKGMESMLPQSQVMYVKGSKSRVEQQTAGGSTIVISDKEAGTSTVLTEAMGQKYKMTFDAESLKKMIETQGNPKIKYLEGSKEIAGYSCKKAEATMEGMDKPAVFYYTEKIQPVGLRGMEKLQLKGMPLEYTIAAQGLTMTMSASEVKSESVDDHLFEIPDGYMEMPDQMKQMMGNH